MGQTAHQRIGRTLKRAWRSAIAGAGSILDIGGTTKPRVSSKNRPTGLRGLLADRDNLQNDWVKATDFVSRTEDPPG